MSIEREMQALGFSLANTGGNCTAYERQFDSGHYILITIADDAEAPTSMNEPVSCGFYGPNHSESLIDISAPTMLEAISKMNEAIGVPS